MSTPWILYVDDERSNRIVFEQSLPDFHIKSVESAERALEVLAAEEIAVLVTDMRMPGMTGEELLRIAKEHHPEVVRVVVTAHQDIGPILRSVNEGLVARYIIKPWDHDELITILRWATEAWRFGRDSGELQRRLVETERLATLGTVASLLVHDLKQPLMSLLVNIETLSELSSAMPDLRALVDPSALHEPERGQLLRLSDELAPISDDLRAATLHLGALIDQLRGFGVPRVVPGASPTARPAIDPLPIVRHAMTVCQELVVKNQGFLDYQGPSNLPRVRMSATELMQILINLVVNAAQAVEARGAPNGRVSIAARTDENMLELQVRDTGVGMARETLEKIGTPFFTTRTNGTGLGVAQCQRLVGTAGGRLRFQSEQGVGTTVTIVLPLAS